MTPATAEAERHLATARTSAGEARDRLAIVEERLVELATDLAAAEREIVTAIETGRDPSTARSQRLRVMADRANLTQEREVLAGLFDRRKRHESAALADLEAARREGYSRETAALAEEIRNLVAGIIERVEKVGLLDAADHRSKGIARDCGVESPLPRPIDRAGLTWIWPGLQDMLQWRGRLDSRAKQPGT